MKRDTGVGCIEFTGGNMLKVPPAATDPNEANLNLEIKVFKLNPDGSKGELIRIEPAFPEGWDTPIFNTKKKEEEKMYPRKDRDEIVATAKKLMAEGKSMTKAAEILKLPLSTLATWLSKDDKQKETKIESEADDNSGFSAEDDKPIPYMPVDEPAPPLKMNYDQAVNQLTLSFIFDIYDSDLAPIDKLGLISKQIEVWKEL